MKSIYNLFTATCFIMHSAWAATSITLPGTQESNSWNNLSSAVYPSSSGYPTSFMTTLQNWPAPLVAQSGGGSAVFGKVDGTGGYFAAAGFVYNFNDPGLYFLRDLSPLSGMQTLVLQWEMSQGPGIAPMLFLNGGTAGLIADFTRGEMGDTYPNFLYQWDLQSVGSIASYEVRWGTDPHTALKRMDVDSSTQFVQVIPEPSACLLSLLSACVFLRRSRS